MENSLLEKNSMRNNALGFLSILKIKVDRWEYTESSHFKEYKKSQGLMVGGRNLNAFYAIENR